MLYKSLAPTMINNQNQITVNRARAMVAAERGDGSGRGTVFHQVFTQYQVRACVRVAIIVQSR